MSDGRNPGDKNFPSILERFTGYTLPLKQYQVVRYKNVCPGCVVKNGPNNYWGAIHEDVQVWEDAKHWFVCEDCYRDLQREGKIW